jgi:hypothetical protein
LPTKLFNEFENFNLSTNIHPPSWFDQNICSETLLDPFTDNELLLVSTAEAACGEAWIKGAKPQRFPKAHELSTQRAYSNES